MPSFMKDEMKKKDEEKLADMQREIDAAVAPAMEEPSAEEIPEGEVPQEEVPVDETAAQIEKLTADLQESESSLKRLRADFENFRRRTAKEKEELADVVAQELLRDMLPLLDNFGRAMASEEKGGENFHKGVEMIFTQFQEVLKKHGLEEIETKGAKFDPNFHQAVMRVQNPEMEDDSVAAELQKGYVVKGRVIRPSMVQVVSNG